MRDKIKVSYEKLRMLTREKGMNLTSVIIDCDIAKGTVTKIMNDGNVTVFTLAKICKYLGIDIGDAVEILKY